MAEIAPLYLERPEPHMLHKQYMAAWVDGDEVIIHRGRVGKNYRVTRQVLSTHEEAVQALRKIIPGHLGAGFAEVQTPPEGYQTVCVSQESELFSRDFAGCHRLIVHPPKDEESFNGVPVTYGMMAW